MTLKEQPLPDKKPHTCLTNSKGIFHMKDDILVFVEKRNGQLQKTSAKLIGGARRLAKKSGGRVLALLAGYQLAEDAKRLQRAGADEVLLADSLSLAEYSTACYADVCQAALRTVKPFLFLFGSTTIGIGLASALGARLDAGLAVDCTELWISQEVPFSCHMSRPNLDGASVDSLCCQNT